MLDLSALSVLAHHDGTTWWRYDGEWSKKFFDDPRVAGWFKEGDILDARDGKFLFLGKSGAGGQATFAQFVQAAGG